MTQNTRVSGSGHTDSDRSGALSFPCVLNSTTSPDENARPNAFISYTHIASVTSACAILTTCVCFLFYNTADQNAKLAFKFQMTAPVNR